MHKEEIIFLHLTLFQLKQMFERAGFTNDFFSAYERLDIIPAHLYKHKNDHKKAILTLCNVILEIFKNQEEITMLLKKSPSLKTLLRTQGL